MIEIVCLVNSIGKTLNTRAEKYNLRCSRILANSPELNEKKNDVTNFFFFSSYSV